MVSAPHFKNNNRATIIAALALVCACGLFGGEPGPLAPASEMIPNAPVAQLEAETATDKSRHSLARIPADAIVAFEHDGDETYYTAVRVSLDNAEAIKLHIQDVGLASGSRIFVYRMRDGQAVDVQGPFEGAGPTSTGEFWTKPVPGNEAIVELQVSGELPADLPFRISEVEAAQVVEAEVTEPVVVSAEAEIRVGNYRGIDLTYEVKNGLAIFEGDIILGSADEIEPARGEKGRAREALAITGSRYRWPGGVIPYTIVSALTGDARIAAAVQHWNTTMAGTITLVPRTNQSNYVQFTRPTDASRCSASVGMQGYGVQYVNLGDYCGTGNAIHEIGHAVGLWHEQGREDRNNYVRILTENIKSTALYNFNQQISNGDDVGIYDYGSIMHYGAYSFSSNGLPTIETIPAGIPIGQRGGLSTRDIEGVRIMYGGSAPAPTPTPTPSTVNVTFQSNPTGMPISVDGLSRTAPFTVTWTVGTTHTIAALNPLTTTTTRTAFTSWNHGGAQSQTVTASSTVTGYTANYSQSYSVQTAVFPPGTGNVSKSPQTYDNYYPLNTTLSLNATPVDGYCFAGWSGLISGTSSSTSLTVNTAYALTANFSSGAVTLTSNNYSSTSSRATSYYIGVFANSTCNWTARSNVEWITVKQSVLQGNGYVTLKLKANNTRAPRYGTVTIGNQTVTVYQGM